MTKKRRVRNDSPPTEFSLPGVSVSLEPETTDYLVPVGIPGFYQSPVEPVDPRDCERWEDSPYCGGNPLNTDFIDLTPDFSINPCEQCITFSPVLGGISLPPYTICRRSDSPECRVEIEPQPISEADVVQGGFFDVSQQCPCHVYTVRWTTHLSGTTFTNERNCVAPVVGVYIKNGSHQTSHKSNQIPEYDDPIFGLRTVCLESRSPLYEDYKPANCVDQRLLVACEVFGGLEGISDISIQYNPVADKAFRERGGTWQRCTLDPGDAYGPQNVQPYPPYPPNEDCDCMACCGDEDTKELLQKIAKRLGTDDYPLTVPQSLLADRGNGSVEVPSLTQFVYWFVKQFDALTGQFPIEIEVKDSDPTKQGDQKQKISIPNLAEGIAELVGITLGSNINTNTLINTCIRILTEAGSAKVHALESKYIAQAIADYLAFDAEETKTPVPMTFTAGKFELDDILQETELTVPLYNYNDDRDFRAEMTELLHAAAIIRAVHFKKTANGGDIKGELMKRFKELVDLAEDKDDSSQNVATTDFDDFKQKVELGFINVAGISDSLYPYGRGYGERPKIREIGDTSDNTDEVI